MLGPQKQAKKLIAGPGGVAICDGCAGKASHVIATGQPVATMLSAIKALPASSTTAKCSFCGKTRQQVSGLAAAAGTTTAGVLICDECLALCEEIIRE